MQNEMSNEEEKEISLMPKYDHITKMKVQVLKNHVQNMFMDKTMKTKTC